eukprot:gene23214-biopygen1241
MDLLISAQRCGPARTRCGCAKDTDVASSPAAQRLSRGPEFGVLSVQSAGKMVPQVSILLSLDTGVHSSTHGVWCGKLPGRQPVAIVVNWCQLSLDRCWQYHGIQPQLTPHRGDPGVRHGLRLEDLSPISPQNITFVGCGRGKTMRFGNLDRPRQGVPLSGFVFARTNKTRTNGDDWHLLTPVIQWWLPQQAAARVGRGRRRGGPRRRARCRQRRGRGGADRVGGDAPARRRPADGLHRRAAGARGRRLRGRPGAAMPAPRPRHARSTGGSKNPELRGATENRENGAAQSNTEQHGVPPRIVHYLSHELVIFAGLRG